MSRAVSGTIHRKRRDKVLKLAKGYRGSRSTLYRIAHEAVEKALAYSYRDRRVRKRDFRRLWIARINAATRAKGLTYSQFIRGLKIAKIEMNRKMLSELAIHSPESFDALVKTARAGIAGA